MKTLWIVSGGMEAVPGIRLAKAMGLHVVVSDGSAQAPGFTEADHGIVASTYDAEGTAAAALRYHREVRPVDGVLSVAADVPVTVATVAKALGLPGLGLETAHLATDKLAMKERFVQRGIPVPWFAQVGSGAAIRTLARERGRILVVKPVDSRGARGVVRLTAQVDPDWAFEQARACSPTGRVMVEEFLSGRQFSTESLLVDGRAATPGFAERNYEFLERFAPHIIENGGHQPPDMPAADRQAVVELAEAAGRALGVATGVVKGDMVLTPDGPRVIEIATRLSGGWFCTDQIPLATGVDLVGAAIRTALGEAPDPAGLRPTRQLGMAIRYLFPPPGVVRSVTGEAQVKALPHVHRCMVFTGPGQTVEPVTNHTRRAGLVICSAPTCAEAVARAEAAVAMIRIDTGTTP